MDLWQLIMGPLTAQNSYNIEKTLKANSQLVKDLDREAATKLLRDAVRSRRHSFSTKILGLIEEYNIDIDPLELALSQGNLQKTEFLLQNGARLEGFSPAECIFWNRKVDVRMDMLLLLLKHGLDTNFQNGRHKNLLNLLTLHSDWDDVNAVPIAKILINSGVSVNEADYLHLTPLHYSIFNGHVDLVSLYIENGADVGRVDNLQRPPLFMAALAGRENVVQLLLQRGSDINARSPGSGRTVLHYACNYNHPKSIALLIQKGADVNAKDVYGGTPVFQLNSENCNYDACLSLVIKEISRLGFENIPVSESNLKFIRTNEKARESFKNAQSELNLMSKTKFYGHFTYYAVLKMTKNIKKLAHLTKNEEFLEQFETNIGSFPYYEQDLREVMDKAIQVRNQLDSVESSLKYTFTDFFPDIVIRKLTGNLTFKDLPLT